MPDQLVDYNPEKTQEWKQSMMDKNKVQTLQQVCANCGTTEYGSGSRCKRCHFPIRLKQLGEKQGSGIGSNTFLS